MLGGIVRHLHAAFGNGGYSALPSNGFSDAAHPFGLSKGLRFCYIVDLTRSARIGYCQGDGPGDVLHISARAAPPGPAFIKEDGRAVVVHALDVAVKAVLAVAW